MKIMPRFQGRALKFGKQWGFEINVTIGDSEPLSCLFKKELYLTKEAAIQKMSEVIPDLVDTVLKAMAQPNRVHREPAETRPHS